MDDLFILIGKDIQGNLTGPIAKKTFATSELAEDHAKTVLNSGGNSNLAEVYVMAISIARRVSPPVEIVPVLRNKTSIAA